MEDPVTEPETTDATDSFLLTADAALSVWSDLEEALAGKNGFGGDVAEIYAYLLVFGGVNRFRSADETGMAELAAIAGSHLTHIARRFVTLRKATIAIEERPREFRPLDLSVESLPPFDWRIHLRVTPAEASEPSPQDAWNKLRADFGTLMNRCMDNARSLQQLTEQLQQQQAKKHRNKKSKPKKARRRAS